MKKLLILFMSLLLVTPNFTSLAQEDSMKGIERKIFKAIGNNLVEISEEQYQDECEKASNQKVLSAIKKDSTIGIGMKDYIGGYTYKRKYEETSNDEYTAFMKYYALPAKNNTDDPTKLTITSGESVEAQGSFNFTLSSKIKEVLEGSIGFNFSKKVTHTITRSDEMETRVGKYGYIYIVGNVYESKGIYTENCYNSTTGKLITSRSTSTEINPKIVKSIYVILETSWGYPTYEYMDKL